MPALGSFGGQRKGLLLDPPDSGPASPRPLAIRPVSGVGLVTPTDAAVMPSLTSRELRHTSPRPQLWPQSEAEQPTAAPYASKQLCPLPSLKCR